MRTKSGRGLAASNWSYGAHSFGCKSPFGAPTQDKKKEGLTQSFAMIRFSDHRVVISLRQIKDQALEGYAPENISP